MFDDFCDFALAAVAGDKKKARKAARRMAKAMKDEPDKKYRRDYGGNKFGPPMYHLYIKCAKCKKYVWHNSLTCELCPPCVIALPQFELEISFKRSKAKNYRTALRRVREIPCYVNDGDMHTVRFDTLSEYCEHREAVERLTGVIWRWASFKGTLNGQEVTSYNIRCIQGEINRMRDLQGAADITFYGGNPIFIPKRHDIEGENIAIDYTHPANIIEVEAVEVCDEDPE